jgi:hypothetical protein
MTDGDIQNSSLLADVNASNITIQPAEQVVLHHMSIPTLMHGKPNASPIRKVVEEEEEASADLPDLSTLAIGQDHGAAGESFDTCLAFHFSEMRPRSIWPI